ncbi:MAG: DUF1501 domain-containing protein, partial [Myxococcales bacterium]|nr:DUF1501 domain-containing protein [Myxococcales bacterium]
MDRREFLQLASLAGLSVVVPFGGKLRADEEPYEGPLWVLVNASGGWDPTSLCDPKGRINEDQEDPVNMYFRDDIGEAGRLRYAPVANHEYFFNKYQDRLCVINGIDTETNSHTTGSRNTWSGRLGEGHPAFSALLAATHGREKPMAMITNGGYDFTAGLIGPTRVDGANTLLRIAYPNLRDPGDENSGIHTEETWSRIVEMQRQRLSSLMEVQTLPRVRQSQSLLFNARSGDNELRRLSEFLPEQLDNSNNPLRRQAQVALAGYKAGITLSVNMNTGGFDTHSNHDNSHIPRLEQVLDGIDFLMDEAERLGVADKVCVAVGSDFGRTPWYNDNMGKDHWSITSMVFMGAGIPGNTVIGATDDYHRPLTVNPDTLELDERGIRIKPVHIHKAMRRLAGITEEMSAQF